MTCHRCGETTPRLTLKQIHCPRCDREVTALLPKPVRGFIPEWRRRDLVKDFSEQRGILV